MYQRINQLLDHHLHEQEDRQTVQQGSPQFVQHLINQLLSLHHFQLLNLYLEYLHLDQVQDHPIYQRINQALDHLVLQLHEP